ncbi:uncharacterized protein isoform X4 [Takifugu rubripes]|uniref:uncharacterized protein isoform X4 n=1 Tax=Takifugu rubripes TaxID=31033 RepID=UPI001145742E|nr:uncharacterized protein LOC105419784 isoform X4 [Takifugu rubripes]
MSEEKELNPSVPDDYLSPSDEDLGSDYVPSSSTHFSDDDEEEEQAPEDAPEGGKPQSKLARHLQMKHKKEEEVAFAMCQPPRSKKRKNLFEKLRNKGNYFHNIVALKEQKGEIVTYRQPSKDLNPEAQDYLPCNICYAFFLKDLLWKHEKSCRIKNAVGKNEPSKRRIQASASALLLGKGQSSKRCTSIITRMNVDDVSYAVKNDTLICEFGERLLEKHGGDPSKDAYISQWLRELGRFLLAVKSLDPKIKSTQDVLVPPKFSLAVAAAKKASGFTKSKYRYNAPSLAIKLGYSLKAVSEILIGQYVKDEAAAGRVRSFVGLLDAEWGLYVSRRARTNLEEGRWNKKEMIPLTEDVMKLQKVLKANEKEAKDQLLNGPNPNAYRTLSECLLSQIILFNRRRQGEVAKMLVATYKAGSVKELNKDVMLCLSKLEQDLSRAFTRIVIRGKRGRKVPFLFTKEMTESLDFLLEKRDENGISVTNEYIFARQNSEHHIRGSDCLRKYAGMSGASRPETLTSTQLRKHVATLSQIMNLKENELDQLAKFMGHDIHIHREYYRLTENTLQLAKMSKLLMAIELGTDSYKGKSLDEIDLSLEIASSEPSGDAGEGPSSAGIFNDDSSHEASDMDVASSEPSGDAGEGPSSAGIFNDDSSHEASDMDEGFITKLLNTIILPNSDVPKKKVKKSKRLSANPLHSLHQRKGGKKITEDSDEEDNSSASYRHPKTIPTKTLE